MQFILVILFAIIIYFIQSVYFRKHWSDGVDISLSYNKSHARIGEEIILTENISNHKLFPLPVVSVKFKTSKSFLFDKAENGVVSDYYYRNDIFSIMGKQQVLRNLSFKTSARGYFIIDSVHLVANDLFLRTAYAKVFPNHTTLYVYPALLRNQQSLLLSKSIIGDILTRKYYEDPLSFRGIRPYNSHDSMRHINWKSTAKNQELMVNTFFDSHNTNICILLNLDTDQMRPSYHLREYILQVAATLITDFISNGFSIQLVSNAIDGITGESLMIPYGAGEEHETSLLEGLSRIDLSKEITSFNRYFEGEQTVFTDNNNLSYIVISNYRRDDLLSLYLKKRQENYSLHFICPEFLSMYIPIKVPDLYLWEVAQNEI